MWVENVALCDDVPAVGKEISRPPQHVVNFWNRDNVAVCVDQDTPQLSVSALYERHGLDIGVYPIGSCDYAEDRTKIANRPTHRAYHRPAVGKHIDLGEVACSGYSTQGRLDSGYTSAMCRESKASRLVASHSYERCACRNSDGFPR